MKHSCRRFGPLTHFVICALLACVTLPSSAQDPTPEITATAQTMIAYFGATSASIAAGNDGPVIFADGALKAETVAVVSLANADCCRARITAWNSQGLQVRAQRLEGMAWMIRGPPGRYTVDIDVINWDTRAEFETTLVVEIGGQAPGPNPPQPDPPTPDPAPTPDPPPPDPTPDLEPIEVDNDYGVGKIAYESAVNADAQAVAKTFRLAAAFISASGDEYKYIGPDNGTSTDQRNVLVWLRLQLDQIPSASSWRKFREAVATALMESQRRSPNGFSSSDWYGAFLEIADAVEARSK